MPIEKHSPTWKTVETEIHEARKRPSGKLRKTGTDLPTTEYQRGYLDALDFVLRLADDKR